MEVGPSGTLVQQTISLGLRRSYNSTQILRFNAQTSVWVTPADPSSSDRSRAGLLRRNVKLNERGYRQLRKGYSGSHSLIVLHAVSLHLAGIVIGSGRGAWLLVLVKVQRFQRQHYAMLFCYVQSYDLYIVSRKSTNSKVRPIKRIWSISGILSEL